MNKKEDCMKINDVIKKPIITEKSTMERTMNSVYCFEVHPKATKSQIKNAIEELFNVNVKKVNTLNFSGKSRRVGRYIGYTNSGKKAYVKLQEGQVISQFEGV